MTSYVGEIDHLKSSADYQKRAIAGLTDSQKELLMLMEDRRIVTYWQSQQIQRPLLNLMGKYGDAQAVVGMISQVKGSATDILGALSPKRLVRYPSLEKIIFIRARL